MTRPVVSVSPASGFESRSRLFSALSEAHEVDFTGPGSARQVSAQLTLDGVTPEGAGPMLVLGGGGGAHVTDDEVQFTAGGRLDPYLRGWSIPHHGIRGSGTAVAFEGRTVLATASDRPIWTTTGDKGSRQDWATLVPDELDPQETLRSRFVPGSFFDLLPILEFLRSLRRAETWSSPPVIAALVMDDPNLRSLRYGYLDFGQLADEALQTPFHLTLAMIPFDRWLTRRSVVDLFLKRSATFSLIVHGNNHTRHELDDGRDAESRLAMLAQALRRMRALSAATGIPVGEVMAAPHGRCSEESSRDMARLGYESMIMSRTFPWLDHPPASRPLAGWGPADTSTPTPVIPRFPLTASPTELPLRAYLRQPIIPFGHHWDLAGNPTLLAEWVSHVMRLGDVRWASVAEISRAMLSTARRGDALVVRPHTRAVDLVVPEGVTNIIVDTPQGEGYEAVELITGPVSTRASADGTSFAVVAGAKVTVKLHSTAEIDAVGVPAPRRSVWPPVRRVLTEARDRTRPRLDVVRGRGATPTQTSGQANTSTGGG